MITDNSLKINKFLKSGALALGLALCSVTGAHNLGVQGKVWEITEVDMRQLVVESALRADLTALRNTREESARKYMDNLPKRTMSVTDKTETRWIDPSIEIASDIQGAEENTTTKEFQWTTMFRKGTRVNPLQVYRPISAMLFFDGNSEKQVKFVGTILKSDKYARVTLIEATGANVGALSTTLGRPVFYANDQMLQRFSINTVPALLYPGSNEHEGRLGLMVMAEPYQLSTLSAAWTLDIMNARGPLTGESNASAQ